MTLSEFNTLKGEQAEALLKSCCGSSQWAAAVIKSGPYEDITHLVQSAEEAWYGSCRENDWLEAFSHHPKIGDLDSLKQKFASTAHLAKDEQAGASTASDSQLAELKAANEKYENQFGFIFIVSAAGKPITEMLQLLKNRLENSRQDELQVAMGEQHKITLLRLQKQMEADWSAVRPGQITTHILDTSLGRPAAGVVISLHSLAGNPVCIATGITNADGRIPGLLPQGRLIPAGIYKMRFHTGEYFREMNKGNFYPHIEVVFEVFDKSHYHIPLLLSPFGYSTYRGS